ncbi:5-oxoprolinase subunit PxpB [Anaerobacillus sp. MEB173]|uniref:5-oxoprolinase subunit PxpB n=1 Tax=Anaerobacillus sp. MEB173 TaxID=3383345 RepID=UPI003F915932
MKKSEDTIEFDIYPLSDTAITVSFGNEIDVQIHKRVKAFTECLDQHSFAGMIEYVPSFCSVTVFYDPIIVDQTYNQNGSSPYLLVHSMIKKMILNIQQKTNEFEQRVIEIPVYYGGEYGPDLEFVAKHNGLTTDEVIHIHSQGEYLVYMLGFAPGFPYLGGMSERISTPRRANPRMKIPKGSVGIAGKQTGVYSIETPGGWQLIGQTPWELFIPDNNPPTLLQAGDLIRFTPITLEEFIELKEGRR